MHTSDVFNSIDIVPLCALEVVSRMPTISGSARNHGNHGGETRPASCRSQGRGTMTKGTFTSSRKSEPLIDCLSSILLSLIHL